MNKVIATSLGFIFSCLLSANIWGSNENNVSALNKKLFESLSDHRIVTEILNKGANVDARDQYRRTPLIVAALMKNSLEVTNTLLAHGADVNAYDNTGASALSLAQNDEVAIRLIEAGADVERVVRNRVVDTHLVASCRARRLRVMENLITRGANVNRATKWGVTPLLAAVIGYRPTSLAPKEFPEGISLLIASGADMNARTKEGLTSLDYAKRLKQTGVISLLNEKGAKENPNLISITEAATAGDRRMVSKHLALGLSANVQSVEGETALILAAKNGHAGIVENLIKAKADLDYTADGNSHPAISYAAMYGRKNIVEILLASRASVNLKGKYGFTPIMFAAIHNHSEIIKLLLKHGADPFLENEQHQNAVTLALQAGSNEAVAILED